MRALSSPDRRDAAASNRHTRALLVTGALVLALVVLAAGIVIGRGTSDLAAGGNAPSVGTGPHGAAQAAATGHARTEAGAALAALRYDTALHGVAGVAAGTRPGILAGMAVDGSAIEHLDRYLDGLLGADLPRDDNGAATGVWRRAPVGYELRSFSDARATVAVWGAWASGELGEVMGGGSNVSVLTLVWEDEDWRLLHIEDQGVIVESLGKLEQFEEVRLAPLG